ncbi:MAG: hypothetical protein E3J22_09000 [Candidatus Aminicenantes bacterium]|nr:MAG: hypothetical protein E3J22_09000 [Candidatus Aminicenantes bacterium]
MIFRIISAASVLGLIFALTLHRFRKSQDASGKGSGSSSAAGYLSWLFHRIFKFLQSAGIKGWKERYNQWIILRHPARERWVILCLGISYCLLAASGFLFALLSSQRLFGSFLLLHFTMGGLFAVCLPLATILRARHYRLDADEPAQGKDTPASGGKAALPWSPIFFWVFVASGLCLIVTALTLMLPYFSLIIQLDFFEVHRYSALVSLLSAIAFAYFSRVNDKK